MRPKTKPRSSSATMQSIIDDISPAIFLPSPHVLYATLAAVVSNHFENTMPVWFMIVGPSGSGKTLMIDAIADIPGMVECGALTGHAAFLSAARRPEKKKGSTDTSMATGGILLQLGKFGFLTSRDFTTVLSQNQERRLEVLAALREIADGSWTRSVGTEGGTQLTWTGKAGFIGGVTSVIDTHSSVIQQLGQRWLYWRYPPSSHYRETQLALTRDRLPSWVAPKINEYLQALDMRPDMPVPEELGARDLDRIIVIAQLIGKCRVSTVKNIYDKQDWSVPEVESPVRLAMALQSMYLGMRWLSIEPHDCWKVIYRLAIDSIPNVRGLIIKALLKWNYTSGPPNTNQLAHSILCGPSTAGDALRDLSLVGVVKTVEVTRGASVGWRLSDETLSVIQRVQNFILAEEESYNDIDIDIE